MITPAWYPAAGYLRAAQQLKARGCLALLIWPLFFPWVQHAYCENWLFTCCLVVLSLARITQMTDVIHFIFLRGQKLTAHLCMTQVGASLTWEKKESQFEFSKIHLQVNTQMHQYWLYHPYFPLPVERGYFFVVRKQCNRQLHSLTVKSRPP